MLDSVRSVLVGTSGLVATEVAPVMIDAVHIPITTWSQAVMQVVIAVATLFSLFKKRKR